MYNLYSISLFAWLYVYISLWHAQLFISLYQKHFPSIFIFFWNGCLSHQIRLNYKWVVSSCSVIDKTTLNNFHKDTYSHRRNFTCVEYRFKAWGVFTFTFAKICICNGYILFRMVLWTFIFYVFDFRNKTMRNNEEIQQDRHIFPLFSSSLCSIDGILRYRNALVTRSPWLIHCYGAPGCTITESCMSG